MRGLLLGKCPHYGIQVEPNPPASANGGDPPPGCPAVDRPGRDADGSGDSCGVHEIWPDGLTASVGRPYGEAGRVIQHSATERGSRGSDFVG